MHPICFAFVAGVLCAAANTQTGRPPTRVGTAYDMVQFARSSQSGSAFANVSPAVTGVTALEIHPNAYGGVRLAGEFYVIATVFRVGGAGVMTGVLDTNVDPWAFVETTVADFGSLVATTGWTSATMTPDLEVVIAETPTGVMWSVRGSRTVTFPPLIDTRLANPSDVKLYRLDDGFEYVAWNGGSQILSQRIDRTRYALGLPPRFSSGLLTLLSPVFHPLGDAEPLEDVNGDARAVIHTAELIPGVGRPWFNGRAIIGNSEPSKQFHTGPSDSSDFAHPGHLAGTTLYCVQKSGAPPLVKAIPIVASSGDNVPAAGGVANLTAWLPFFDRLHPPAAPWAVTLLVGPPLNDLVIPGWRGKLAVGPQFVALPAQLWTSRSLQLDWVVPTPAVAAGTTLWVQTLAFDPAGQFDGENNGADYFYLGNTAALSFN